MKTIFALCLSFMLTAPVVAAIKCVPDGRGGMCCWDTNRDGPFKPLNC